MTTVNVRVGLAAILITVMTAGLVVAVWKDEPVNRTYIVGYFANSNGIFVGDDVRILGVPVGTIDKIEPEPHRAKITFWFDAKYKVPADANAVILSPSLVSVRAIQLTPAYTDGPVMADHTVITEDRTAVPMEWDDLRVQLERLTDTLQPTQPGGVSTLGAFVNAAADNLRGQGTHIRDSILRLSQAMSALGDHSNDIFSTVKNLSILVSALQNSTTLMGRLNQNLAAVTGLLANDPNEVGDAVRDINSVVDDVATFVADNKETVGTTSDKLASVTQALNDSIPDIKQALHVAPTSFQNFINIYQPAQGSMTGVLAVNNFADPISFICGAVQAASRLSSEQAAKLCVQYLAPIVKNRQFNFPPMGTNPFVGASARPNEVTFSEEWMRPDYVPPPANTPLPAEAQPAKPAPAAQHQPTNPADGLEGLMVPPKAGP